ncbi:MAG: metal ABC transporter ATP-binding protein [Acidimicrobiia bacterium]
MSGSPAPLETPLLELRHLSARYGNELVLDHIDFSIGPCGFVGIVGPSGSGKTTLLRVITGTVAPIEGTVVHADGMTVALVPQVETVNWNFPVTVSECVLMARTNRRWPWSSKAERTAVADVLERLGISGLGERHIRELSGGQQQRVFLARALLRQPDLLLMDEPTSGVDVRTRHEILHLLEDLNAQGVAMILTTHDLNGIAAHLPRLVCVNKRILGDGAPNQVLTPDVLEATYGARMEVLEHAGMPVVIEGRGQIGQRAQIDLRTPDGRTNRMSRKRAG